MTNDDDGIRPPFIEPEGPLHDDESVVRAFSRGMPPGGHSARFHVEGPSLVADRDVGLAISIGWSTILVRTDHPDDIEPDRRLLERVMGEEGLTLLDESTLLGPAVAMQVLGIRLSNWDLWGSDIDRAFAALREAAAGEHLLSFLPGGDEPGSIGD